MSATGTTGESVAAMRVLICDQETEMLESIARSFDVDVATSKATCIDLMRANVFDVLIASERLSDGSGLELLSHVATRWPDTLRVLAIEPQRLKLLRGKLGPFRLHATIRYPMDEDEVESVLMQLDALLGAPEEEPEPQPAPPPPPPRAAPAARPSAPMPRAAPPTGPLKVQKVELSPANRLVSSTNTRANQVPPAKAAAPSRPAAPGTPQPPPVRRRLGDYTPLGAPEEDKLRIIERGFDRDIAPLAARAIRTRAEANRPKSRAEKLSQLAARLRRTLARLLGR